MAEAKTGGSCAAGAGVRLRALRCGRRAAPAGDSPGVGGDSSLMPKPGSGVEPGAGPGGGLVAVPAAGPGVEAGLEVGDDSTDRARALGK